ncbi:uncharacterized protein LOC135961843 [Calliphora vicina]|uniref:uncharacterized protein LOC135961843 n=1 Tax=Calliphora vicina TaxID=7373 RepID=UPI00325BE9E7
MLTKICGQSLKKFAIFIGVVYLLQAIIISVALLLDLIKYKEDKSKASAEGLPYDEDREVVSSLSVSICFSLTFVLTSPFLIWGAIKEKHTFLIPWLYNSFFCIIVNSIYLFVIVVKNFYNLDKTSREVNQFVTMILMMGVGLTLQLIFYRIVYRLYKELVSEQQLRYLENSSTIFIVDGEHTTDQS